MDESKCFTSQKYFKIDINAKNYKFLKIEDLGAPKRPKTPNFDGLSKMSKNKPF